MLTQRQIISRSTLSILLPLASVACSDADVAPVEETGDPKYVLAALVSSGDESNMYVSLVDSLDGQTVDHELGLEFSGTSDLWVYDDALFVADGEEQTIIKFTLEGRELVEEARISFVDYGPVTFGFWSNVFVSPTKAYYLNDVAEFIIWNPSEMAIEGTLPLPELESEGIYSPIPAYSDRAVQVRDGLLYQPIYYSDESYFNHTQNSTILVVDIATDEVVDTLEAPCPGLDYSTIAENGDIYFSSWVFSPPGAAVLDGPKTCVVKVPASDPNTVEVAFDVADLTDGREGGVLSYTGDGHATLSVLHDEEAPEEDADDVSAVGFGPYWRFWSVDLSDNTAVELEGVDWNGGAAYPAQTEDPLVLIPGGGYADTSVYNLGEDPPEVVLKTQGWALRLFEL